MSKGVNDYKFSTIWHKFAQFITFKTFGFIIHCIIK